MKISHIIVTIGMVAASLQPCLAVDIFFRNIDAKDGLADNLVKDITRDSYGYLWFSTINGLSRYDGYRLLNYMPLQLGGRANQVTAVRETADTTLWMVSIHELYTYDRVKDTWQKDGAARLAKMGIEGAMTLFYVDDRHNLWVATETGLYHYDYSQHKLQHFSNYSRSAIGHIVSKNGTTLVVTTDYKIYEVALKENRLILIAQAPLETYNRDSMIFLDSHMNLWVFNSHSEAGTQWQFSLKTRQWRQLLELQQMGNAHVNAIAEDNDGHLWVGTGNADIQIFSYEGDKLQLLMRTKAFLPHSSHTSCFYLDDNNTMWVGSAKLGIAYTDMNSPRFNHISTGDYEDVSSLLQDGKGNLWIGFDGGGVMMKSPTGAVTHYSASLKQLPSNIVTSLAIHQDGSILVGSYGDGIAKFNGSIFAPLYPEDNNLTYVKAMITDTHGCLWVATVDKGIVKIKPDGNHVNYTSENSPLLSNGLLCLAYDSVNDILYIGTSVGVSTYDCAKGSFIQIEQMDQLKGSYISSLLICSRNSVWVGSRNGLWVYSPKNDSISHLTMEQGLSHNVIRALAKATGGQTKPENENRDCIWASTDNGLTCITPDLQCYTFLDSDGLHDIVFSNNAALTASDGAALLGSFTGYVSIPPENIISHFPRLHIEFTDYRINGVENDQFPIDHTMRHDDRLGISVSAMVPALTNKIRYFYRFKGEKKWARVPGNMLYFAGLQPGTHVLQVRAELPGMTGNGQEDTGGISELTIKVIPPLWLSLPAFLLYLLLIAVIAWLLYNTMRRRQKRELAIKQLEMNLEKYEMEEEKIRFFTNISHDLKTPLTLVVAPLEKIRQNNLPHSIRTELDVAWRNARQLYDLILQLLDFRKLDVGMEKLNLRHGDIVTFVKQAVQGFTYYATRKQVRLQMQLPPAPMMINFDENKIRRIISNLLSNAYKYNADNGTVTVSLDIPQADGAKKLVLSVADTGIGINDKQHIFDRFMQESHGQEQEGSGIGLHIVKQYVNMMGGHISVADNEPKGTVFTVTLPVDESIDGNVEELSPDNDIQTDELITDHGVQNKATILVVDDNTDARLFLQRSLDDEYLVLVAANGREALQMLAKKDNISLIVSDVMMPEMDGIELFREIKSNINYSHIPVILLTAKSSEENIVAGLEEGVADYITKPFSLAVLRLRIRKVLEWSQKVYNIVATGIEIKPSEITVSSLDEELISHVISNIEANMQDVNYSVVQLSSDVGMTRGHLYKKLMAITGKSPLEFIRIIKLKRGKSLLDQGRTNISEVADMVGLSAKQFAHYFKLMYDDTPSEYLKKRHH
jgi:signal transduction histidine kinase/ligand-binding sensor domain-containing protein/DNA-binding NarL/FixJ family response regulator